MVASWAVILTALVYLCFLFVVAHWGDRTGRRVFRRRARSTVYALALGVYCTSWTFYGSVGLATRSGLDFLAIYIGPILVFGIGYPLVQRVIRIAKAQNITSIADFVGARYGKSESVAALVCVIAVVSAVPYTALQLKAMSSSVQVLLQADGNYGSQFPLFGDVALLIALGLAGFAIAFGTRGADATEHQHGLVIAVALESVVKITAFLVVGIFVTYGMFSGFGDIVRRVASPHHAFELLGPTSDGLSYAALVGISAMASLLLPRQFHMSVVENRSPDDVKRAAWLFPLYLVLINVFVVPIALAGLHLFPGPDTDRDMTVLALPLHAGSGLVAMIAYLGGLSAATAMVIVETVAVSIMVSNHLAMPLALRRRAVQPGGRRAERPPSASFVLAVRRLSILALILLSYVYYRVAGSDELASIGLLSFAAIAQVAPAFVGGLFWRRGTSLGASAGLLIGIVAWTYTLLVPTLVSGDNLLLTEGPFGIGMLRPTAIFGLSMPPLTHGVLWSLGPNILAYLAFSLLRPATALERLQASAFVGGTRTPIAPTLRLFRVSVSVDELRGAVGRFLGEERTRRSFAGFARSRGMALEGSTDADIHLLRYAEHLLASVIGAASSRLALSLVLRRRNLSPDAALRLLDDASAAIQQNRDLLQHALDHAQQGINVLDRDLRLLFWNQAFIDLYDFPPDLVGIGVGLEEIVRLNAERGAYGPGPIDDLVAARLHSLVRDHGPLRLKLWTTQRVISTRSNQLPGGGLFITYTDVTEIVAGEEALERTNETLEHRVQERTEELTRLNEELIRAKHEAEAANASKTRFLAAASHDILQPLNAARLYATSLVERAPAGREAALAENIDASLDSVEEILTSLLDISRLDTGALKPQWSTVALDELFRQLAREFDPVAAERGLELRFERTSLSVRSDRGLLRRLLQNLVSNAIKYTPAGRVLVGARRRGTQVRLEIWDTGIGIAAANQTTVFQEFRRLPEGVKTARGLGLGLSIVERIATTLDSRVRLSSEPGRGSVFRMDVPRTATIPPVPVPAGRLARSHALIAPLTSLAVLVIDNEPAVLDGMRTLLDGWGCDVVTATSFEEVSRGFEIAPWRPDILVADFHLDDGDGLSTIRSVRDAIERDLPAVLITADRSPALRDGAAQLGIDLLNKPVKPAALRALLSRVGAARMAAE